MTIHHYTTSLLGIFVLHFSFKIFIGEIPLVRIRNPWGNETEWNGAWSDGSAEWQYIPDEEKDNIGLNFENDGEFWMSYKDFRNNWDQLEICNLSPHALEGDDCSQHHTWNVKQVEG